jgi:hypothetical protein
VADGIVYMCVLIACTTLDAPAVSVPIACTTLDARAVTTTQIDHATVHAVVARLLASEPDSGAALARRQKNIDRRPPMFPRTFALAHTPAARVSAGLHAGSRLYAHAGPRDAGAVLQLPEALAPAHRLDLSALLDGMTDEFAPC